MFASNKENTPVFSSKNENFDLKSLKNDLKLFKTQEEVTPSVYDDDILQCYLESEKKNQLTPNFFDTQTELTISNRKTIIEWLVDYHQRCRLKQESLYLAIQVFDRYLMKNNITRISIQVNVVAALRVACKYCELNPIRGIHSASWTKEELIQKENEFLAFFDYNLTSIVTPFVFLKKYELENPKLPKCSVMANFFTELSYLYIDSVTYLPSEIASASFQLACEILGVKPKVELVQKNEDCKQYLIYLFKRKKFVTLEKKYSNISISEIENFINKDF
jgi:G2/mitotic-specific cyclin 3/4